MMTRHPNPNRIKVYKRAVDRWIVKSPPMRDDQAYGVFGTKEEAYAFRNDMLVGEAAS